jgi:hypothetical protein
MTGVETVLAGSPVKTEQRMISTGNKKDTICASVSAETDRKCAAKVV